MISPFESAVSFRRACASILLAVSIAACSKSPDVAKREFVESGDRYMANQQTAEAIIEYRNAIQIDPAFAEARRKLSDAYFAVGDRAGGRSELVRAADLTPTDANLQVLAGRLLLLSGQFDDARTRADKALSVDTKHVGALILRANALAGLKDFDAAVTELESAITLAPSMAEAYTTLGAMQMVRGDRAEAEAAFQKALATAPDSVETRLAIANYYLATNRRSEAEATLKAVLGIEPGNLMAARALAYFYVASGRATLAEPLLTSVADRDKTGDGSLALASYYLSQRRPDDAARILSGLVDRGGDAAQAARLQLATLAMTAKDTAKATALVDQVLKTEPSNTRALAARAELYAAAGNLEKALATAQQATAADGRSALARYALGKVHVLRREEAEAIAAFTEALQVNPRLTPAKIELAKLLLSAGRLAEAEREARSAQGDLPASGDVRLLVARIQLARGQMAGEPTIRELARMQPGNPDVETALGLVELRRGNRTQARAAFERATATAPSHAEAIRHLVAIDIADRRFDSARARVTALMAARPDDTAATLLASSTYAATGDVARAVTLARGVIDAHPDALDAYVMLGRIYLSAKRVDEAIAQYRALADKQPRSVPVHTVIGLLLQAQNKMAEARAEYEEVLKLDGSAAVASNNLAWIYAEEGGNLDVALRLAQTAKSKLPTAPEVNDTLGWIYVKKGLHGLAIPPLELAATASPQDANHHYHLSVAYAGAGQADKARVSAARALELGTLPQADAARARDLAQTAR